MDNKKVQVTIVISLVICLVAILVVGSATKKENFKPQKIDSNSKYTYDDSSLEDELKSISDELNSGKYYIYLVEDYMPNESDTLEIGVDGTATLKIVDLTSVDGENSSTYSFDLSSEEFEKVKIILEHISTKNNLNTNEDYNLYYNDEQHDIALDDKEHLYDIVDALTNIALDTETIDNMTCREIGNNSLDSIILEMNLDNVFK